MIYLNKHTVAVIAAAGSGSRMGMDKNKLFLDFSGKPVLLHTLEQFQRAENIDKIIVSTRPELIDEIKSMAQVNNITKLFDVIAGGDTRQQSVSAAVSLCKNADFIAIHDGARPFADSLLIDRVCKEAYKYGAAAPGVKVKDTVKRIDGDGFICETVDREELVNIQTPQIFNYRLYCQALENSQKNNLDFTDDCQLIESLGVKIKIVEGDYLNIKITTKDDILFAEKIFSSRCYKCSE